jgi:hypothetical protein
MSSRVVSHVVRSRSPMFWKPYLFPSSGSHVILHVFPDAKEREKLSATAVHFCFELMCLVNEVFVSCVFDV